MKIGPHVRTSETRERTVRMHHERLADAQCSKVATHTHVGSLLVENSATPMSVACSAIPVSR